MRKFSFASLSAAFTSLLVVSCLVSVAAAQEAAKPNILDLQEEVNRTKCDTTWNSAILTLLRWPKSVRLSPES